MGLLQNGYRDKIGVFKTYGGSFHNNSFPQGTLGNYNLTGAKRNLTAGEGITDPKVGLPNGYVGKGWQLPQKAGFISSRAASMSVSATGSMLRGYPIEGAAAITFTVADAAGQLISSGAGSASMTFTVADALLTASIGGTGTASFAITTNTPVLGALASGEGSAAITFTVADAQAYPLNDASPLRTGSASFAITGTLTPYAIGSMSGSTVDTGILTNDSISAAVWTAIGSQYLDSLTMGGKLNTASSGGVDLESLAQAVLAALNATTIPVNVEKMNNAEVIGTGTAGDGWRGVGVSA